MLNNNQEITDRETEENYLFSAEQEADKIVNDIFADLNDILDHGEDDLNFTAEVKTNDQVLEEDNTPLPLEAELLSEITPKKEEIIEQKYFDSTAFAEQEVLREESGLIKHLDKLLFVGSFSFLIGMIGWLITTEKIKFPISVIENQSVVAVENTTSSKNQDFANYLLQSLKIIDQENPIIASNSEPINNQKSPEKTHPNNINNSPSSPTKIIERIYIPFAQPSPRPSPSIPTPPPIQVKQTPTPPPIQVRPTPTPPPIQVKQTPTPPPIQVRPTPTPPPIQVRPTPTPPPIQVRPTPTPPPIQVRPTPTPPPIASETKTSPTVETPVTEVASVPDRHTVVGLLESGERNFALIEVNGATRRIQVGEIIDSSGWKLESVDNDLIIIKSKDQQRSLSVGQQF